MKGDLQPEVRPQTNRVKATLSLKDVLRDMVALQPASEGYGRTRSAYCLKLLPGARER